MNPLDTYEALVARGASPALTLYGSSAGAPRLELSGKVVANHAAKAANFIADEYMIDPGDTVHLDLPAHWRLLTWGLGSLLAGAHVSFREGDLVITSKPEADDDDAVIAVSLGALDLSWPGELPASVVDGNAEVLAQADILIDSFQAPESNAGEFATTITTDGQRLLLVEPHPADLLGIFLTAMVEGRTLVVADRNLAEKAQEVEGAVPFKN